MKRKTYWTEYQLYGGVDTQLWLVYEFPLPHLPIVPDDCMSNNPPKAKLTFSKTDDWF